MKHAIRKDIIVFIQPLSKETRFFFLQTPVKNIHNNNFTKSLLKLCLKNCSKLIYAINKGKLTVSIFQE